MILLCSTLEYIAVLGLNYSHFQEESAQKTSPWNLNRLKDALASASGRSSRR